MMFEINDNMRQLNLLHASQYQRDILSWLTPIDYSFQQHDLINQRIDGTGNWLLNSQIFLAWLEEPGRALLCRGLPGAGKTILASVAIDYLAKQVQTAPKTGLAFIFCDYRKKNEQTIYSLLANLLKQLSHLLDPLPQSIVALFEVYKRCGTRPTLEEIFGILKDLIRHYDRVFIVVDALDQCPVTSDCRWEFLSTLSKLQFGFKINTFMTSRDIPDIVESFTSAMVLNVQAKKDDLQIYVEKSLARATGFVGRDPTIQAEITAAIVQAAGGM